MPSLEISTVMFDLGDTLFEPLNSKFIQKNLEDVAHTVNFNNGTLELLSEFRITRNRIEHELSASKLTFYLHREFIGKVLVSMFESFGYSIEVKVVEQFCDAQRDAVIANLRPRKDCVTTLERFRALGYKLAIVSNIDDEWLEPIKEHWNLDRFVDGVLSSEEARSCKPDSSIFLQACRMIDVHPQQVIFVGDSAVNDVAGSRNVGMNPIWFDAGGTKPGHESTPSITELSELENIIAPEAIRREMRLSDN